MTRISIRTSRGSVFLTLSSLLLVLLADAAVTVVNVGTIAGSGRAGMEQGYRHTAMFRDIRGFVVLSDKKYFKSVTEGGTDYTAVPVLPPTALLVTDVSNNCIRIVHLPPAAEAGLNTAVQVFAGSGSGVSGDTLGTGTIARLNRPKGMCWATYRRGWDPNANGDTHQAPANTFKVFIADTDNRQIKKLDTETAEVTWWAGKPGGSYGFQNGSPSAALFKAPWFVVVDVNNMLLVADSYNYVIRSIPESHAGVFTFAGRQGVTGSTDGLALSATFLLPYAMCVGPDNSIYVSSFSPGNTIRKISLGVVTTVLGASTNPAGYYEGIGPDAKFSRIKGLIVDGEGDLYISDADNNRIRRASITNVTDANATSWEWVYDTFPYAGNGTMGHADGDQGLSHFDPVMLNGPTDLALEQRYKPPDDVLYFTSFDNYIRQIQLVTRNGPTPTIPLTPTGLPTASRLPTETRLPTRTHLATETAPPTLTQEHTETITISHEITGTPPETRTESVTVSLNETLSPSLSKTHEATPTYYEAPVRTRTITYYEHQAAPVSPFFDTITGRGLIFFAIVGLIVAVVVGVSKGRKWHFNKIQLRIKRAKEAEEDDRTFGRYTNRFLPEADEALEMAAHTRETHDGVAATNGVAMAGKASAPSASTATTAAGATGTPYVPPNLQSTTGPGSVEIRSEVVEPVLSPLVYAPSAATAAGATSVAVSGAQPEQKFYRARNGAMLPYYDDDDL